MNFSELYLNNKQDAEHKISILWGGEANSVSQQAQVKELKNCIKNLIVPQNAMPVVQCMNSYRAVHSVTPDEAKKTVGPLWTSDFDPYEHQYKSWYTLLHDKYEGKYKSICVTTGTGSGKTECFMMPLVYDLSTNYKKGQIQALFLYPLNALMEDQKERLEKLLEIIENEMGIRLTYTVYNGDLPEDEPSENDHSEEAERDRRKIEMLRGLTTDENGNPKYKFPHMVYTRKAIRKKDSAPNIILTNPTMLEYILLRKKDENLIDPEKESLRWIAIDETHTYTGAGAAELAMLLRRVVLAFGVKAENIRFATSSATFTNSADIIDPIERTAKEAQAKLDLQTFISALTGTSIPQVEVISGEREGICALASCALPDVDKSRWEKICQADYIELDKLFTDGTITEKLQSLDEMCSRIEDLYTEERKTNDKARILMKCKVHYFYRVPNNGLYIKLNEHKDGAFKIYTQESIGLDNPNLPLLELCRCKNCGEFLAVGLLDKQTGRISAIESNDTDMFDLVSDSVDNPKGKQTVFALSNTPVEADDHTGSYDIHNGQVLPATSCNPYDWHLIGNQYMECPCCKKKLTRAADTDNFLDETNEGGIVEDMRLQKLRLSAEFISRILAASTLDQVDAATSKNGITLHKGQQYLSFVDSRQAAAKSTMNQNLEQERLWFYNSIFKELCKRSYSFTKEDAINELNNTSCDKTRTSEERMSALSLLMELNNDNTPQARIEEIINQIKPKGCAIMSWDDIAHHLLNVDKYFIVFCHQFIKKTEESEDLEADGTIKNEAKLKYLYSIMVNYLSNRPATAASHETMGLFRTCYPFLENITIPASVVELNKILNNKVSNKDFRDLLHVFLDYTVRSNQSVFLNMNENGLHQYDIFATERYATEKQRRRTVKKPIFETAGDVSNSRLVRLISGLITDDRSLPDDDQTQKEYFDIIKNIVDDVWKILIDNNILEHSTHYKEGETKQQPDRIRDFIPYRFNLAKMSFTLYDDVYLCDVNKEERGRHVPKWRPIQVNFKGFSPYLMGNRAVKLQDSLHEKWKVYIAGDRNSSSDSLNDWAAQNRSILWNNGLWGKDGIFADRLNSIYLDPELFIQSEHTAQVDKIVARQLQTNFKDHSINILACSTTMEMGVDLGDLEIVMLTSVPPFPANYKQRAGRSGRNNKVKSACITLCGSDAIGLRTLDNPIETIIKRPVDVPTVDLDSQQVIMRHVVSYLIRSFGVFGQGENEGSLNLKVADFYTPFHASWNNNYHCHVYYDDTNAEVTIEHGLGELNDRVGCQIFDKHCSESMKPDMLEDMKVLLKDIPFISHPEEVLVYAQRENKRCYDEIADKIAKLQSTKRNADSNSPGFDSYMTLLKMEYHEILHEKLLNFWSTNRFTPNANMPVNVIPFNLNATKISNNRWRNVSNPSYTLKQAIQQYVPGNKIIVDGVVYVVRGIRTEDEHNEGKTIKQLYRNANKTVVGEDITLDTPIPWNVNGKENLTMVQPVKFLPDPNEDYSRIADENVHTHVSAQLIGTTDWENRVTEPNLFSTRVSDNSGNAKILYYNEGIGFGYAICMTCGKMTLETRKIDERAANIPEEIDNIKNNTKRYHYAINKDRRTHCFGSGKRDRIKRNVIIGDLMQTDYCEIRIRRKNDNNWIGISRNQDVDQKNINLLTTLGIVFCQALVELKGWDRGSVDFTIMQNRHICIFDTNPGGSGYSIKLHENKTMLDVIAASKAILEKAKDEKCKDMLLDKFTLRFLNNIDIYAGLAWIEEQEEANGTYPEPIPSMFNIADVRKTCVRDLINAVNASSGNSTIFANDDFLKWNYGDAVSGWQGRMLGRFFDKRNKVKFCIARKNDLGIEEGIKDMLRDINVIFGETVSTDYEKGKDIYPLAYIDGCLYFTVDKATAALNANWADGEIYCIATDNPAEMATKIDCSINKDTTRIFFINDDNDDGNMITKEIGSKDLGKIIHNYDVKAKAIIDQFLEHCKQNSSYLEVSYLDQHMKSVAAIVLALQTIEYFAKLIKKDIEVKFNLEWYECGEQKKGVFANIITSKKRDEILEMISEKWRDDLDDANYCSKLDIDTAKSGELPHWRVLTLTCKGKRLSIYPNGGFLNEWEFNQPKSTKFYGPHNTTCKDSIPMKRKKSIKYEVHLEDFA